jgi:hypothetical protein
MEWTLKGCGCGKGMGTSQWCGCRHDAVAMLGPDNRCKVDIAVGEQSGHSSTRVEGAGGLL